MPILTITPWPWIIRSTETRKVSQALAFSLILDRSVGLSAGIQSAGDSVRILHSAEEDNLSPFDSKIACLCQSFEINNKYVYMYVYISMYICRCTCIYAYTNEIHVLHIVPCGIYWLHKFINILSRPTVKLHLNERQLYWYTLNAPSLSILVCFC